MEIKYGMGNNERPELAPFPINKSEDQANREIHRHYIAAQVEGMQGRAKKGAGQHRAPHAISLQRLDEVTRFQRLFKNRIAGRIEN